MAFHDVHDVCEPPHVIILTLTDSQNSAYTQDSTAVHYHNNCAVLPYLHTSTVTSQQITDLTMAHHLKN